MAAIYGHHPNGETLDYSDGITDNGDTIIGNAGNDHIYAGKGDDLIKGGGGADFIDGGMGFNTVDYENSSSAVNVNLESNHGHGGDAEGDILINIQGVIGSAHDDTLKGDSQANKLYGGDGNDTLKGGGGADYLDGGNGNDVIEIDGPGSKVRGGDGIDTLVLNSHDGMVVDLSTGAMNTNDDGIGKDGQYNHYVDYFDYGYGYPPPGGFNNDHLPVTGMENIIGSRYDDDLIGNAQDNRLSGQDGNDLLAGRGGDDFLDGGAGNDVLFGGLGADHLTGGAGADTFVFTSSNESAVVNGMPQDVITDFEHGSDKIDLVAVMGDQPANALLTLDNQVVNGVNYSFVGVDANHNGHFDDGEFAVAVQMQPGSVLHLNDYILA